MYEPLDDEATTTEADLDEVLDRLTHRYSPGAERLLPVDAVALVYQAQHSLANDRPAPTEQDLADALLLVTTARENLARRVDLAELTILDGLRSHGWKWERVGTHLGRPPETARQNASIRFQRLLERFPRFRPTRSAT